MNNVQNFNRDRNTFTFPEEKVTVYTSDKQVVNFECKPIEVPLDKDGRPVVNRLQIDAHGNLRVTVSEDDTQLFSRDYWYRVRVDSSQQIMRKG